MDTIGNRDMIAREEATVALITWTLIFGKPGDGSGRRAQGNLEGRLEMSTSSRITPRLLLGIAPPLPASFRFVHFREVKIGAHQADRSPQAQQPAWKRARQRTELR
jgi:hypothetical protein